VVFLRGQGGHQRLNHRFTTPPAPAPGRRSRARAHWLCSAGRLEQSLAQRQADRDGLLLAWFKRKQVGLELQPALKRRMAFRPVEGDTSNEMCAVPRACFRAQRPYGFMPDWRRRSSLPAGRRVIGLPAARRPDSLFPLSTLKKRSV